MSQSDWRERYRAATLTPPVGAKQRVWKALGESKAAPGRRTLVFGALAAAAGALLVLAWPAGRTTSFVGEGMAMQANGAQLVREGRTLRLSEGTLTVSAWGAPVLILARDSRVELAAAVVAVRVAGERVEVLPIEGVVVVNGEAREATERSRALAGDWSAVRSLESADAAALRAQAAGERAVEARAWEAAAAAYGVVAQSGTLRAEAALLKRGELELRHLGRTAQALASFDEGDARFPEGSLGQERALSALEASVSLATWPEVLRRAEAFERRFPSSERLDDVRRVQRAALLSLGRREEACALAARLPGPPAQECRR